MTFQATDARKPLLAVKRLAEKGNRVCFGPSERDNYIESKDSKKRIILKQNGKGSYLLIGHVQGMRDPIEVTVDSGAEESVCPKDWLEEQFGTNTSVKRVNFRHASGGRMPHYGQREILMNSTF